MDGWTEERVLARVRAMIGDPEAADVKFDLHSNYSYTLAAVVAERLRDGPVLLVVETAQLREIEPVILAVVQTGQKARDDAGLVGFAFLRDREQVCERIHATIAVLRADLRCALAARLATA